MATLNESQIDDIWAAFMRENTEPISVEKGDVRDGFVAIDAYIEAALTSAFAVSALSSYSERQKTDQFARVINKRLEVM